MSKRTSPEKIVSENMQAAMEEAEQRARDSAASTVPPTDAQLNASLPTVEQAAQLPDSEQPKTDSADRMAHARKARAARNGAPVGEESKSAKFRRLAMRRVPKALKALTYVANLSNTAQYEYSQEQRDKILTVLKNAVRGVEDAFLNRKSEADGFSL